MPLVKAGGFDALLLLMAGIARCTSAIVAWLPGEAEPARQRVAVG